MGFDWRWVETSPTALFSGKVGSPRSTFPERTTRSMSPATTPAATTTPAPFTASRSSEGSSPDGDPARGINARGDIVGQFGQADVPHCFLYRKGTYII